MRDTHTHTMFAYAARYALRYGCTASRLVCITGCDGGKKIHSSRVGLTATDLEIAQHKCRSIVNGRRVVKCKLL